RSGRTAVVRHHGWRYPTMQESLMHLHEDEPQRRPYREVHELSIVAVVDERSGVCQAMRSGNPPVHLPIAGHVLKYCQEGHARTDYGDRPEQAHNLVRTPV